MKQALEYIIVLVFFDNNIPYVFEHSWEDYRGIIQFEKLEDVYAHLAYRYEFWSDVLEKGYKYYTIVEYDSPPLGIDFEELKAHTNSYPPIIIGKLNDKKDISYKKR